MGREYVTFEQKFEWKYRPNKKEFKMNEKYTIQCAVDNYWSPYYNWKYLNQEKKKSKEVTGCTLTVRKSQPCSIPEPTPVLTDFIYQKIVEYEKNYYEIPKGIKIGIEDYHNLRHELHSQPHYHSGDLSTMFGLQIIVDNSRPAGSIYIVGNRTELIQNHINPF